MVKARKRAGLPPVPDVALRKRAGRPSVAAADRRGTVVRVLVTETEHVELQQAATAVAMSVSTWVRTLALEEARQIAAKKANFSTMIG
jgi:hypothetical protein